LIHTVVNCQVWILLLDSKPGYEKDRYICIIIYLSAWLWSFMQGKLSPFLFSFPLSFSNQWFTCFKDDNMHYSFLSFNGFFFFIAIFAHTHMQLLFLPLSQFTLRIIYGESCFFFGHDTNIIKEYSTDVYTIYAWCRSFSYSICIFMHKVEEERCNRMLNIYLYLYLLIRYTKQIQKKLMPTN
jgi:hypothetical protein